MKIPENQSELVHFISYNASRLDNEHFNAMMSKLEQWKEGRNKPKYNQSLIDKVHNREAVIEVDDFTIIKDLINFIYPDDPYLEDDDEYGCHRDIYGTSLNDAPKESQYYGKHYWFSSFTGNNLDMQDKPRIKASEFLL